MRQQEEPPPADPPAPAPALTESPEPRPAVEREAPIADRSHSRPDAVAIGLLVGGSIAVVGGAAMLGTGAALPGWARRKLQERGGTGDQDRAFLEDADRMSVGLMAGGGVLAGLGIVAAVVGAVRASRRGRARTAGRGPARAHRPFSLGVRPCSTGATIAVQW
jgi:hypothetical protein